MKWKLGSRVFICLWVTERKQECFMFRSKIVFKAKLHFKCTAGGAHHRQSISVFPSAKSFTPSFLLSLLPSFLPSSLSLHFFLPSFLSAYLPSCSYSYLLAYLILHTPSTHSVFMAPSRSRQAVQSLLTRSPPHTLSTRSTMPLLLLGIQPPFHNAMVLGIC